ncbi:polysaccharide deacetylase family protein [Cytobacillus sp. Hm23]
MKIITIAILSIFASYITGCSQSDVTKETVAIDKEKVNSEEITEVDDSNSTNINTTTKSTVEEEFNNTEELEITELEPQYTINPNHWGVEPISDANENVLLLTIDDAPDKYSLQMAHTLQSVNVKAIFFVNGHFIDSEEEQEVLKQIYELGFPIGNHTWSHNNLSELSEVEQYEEIVKLNDEIEKIIGMRPQFFRAPYGVNTEYSKQLVAEESMVLMNWSYGYDFDKKYMTEESILDIMVNTPLLRNGANLLMHDREWTNDALQEIVIQLQKNGYDMVDPALIKINPNIN